jgi:hypothetical protein
VVGVFGQVMSLAEVLKEIDEKAEKTLEPLRRREMDPAPKGHKWYYCPKCLRARTLSRYDVKKGKTTCPWCNEPMRSPPDEEFFKRSEELVEAWRDKSKALIEKVWDVLREWWPYKPMTASVGADVSVYFDYPSHFKVEIERAKGEPKLKAELYAHYFDERNIPMLQKVIEAVKEVGVGMHIAIDARPDHCRVPKERMEEMGFKRHSIWSYWVMEVSP